MEREKIGRDDFIKLIRTFSAIQPYRSPDFQKTEVCWFWYQEFKYYVFEEIKAGLTRFVKAQTYFPSIKELRISIGGVSDIDSLARITALNLISAVTKYGYPNWDLAQKFIGSFGERVVERFGGWPNFCEIANQQTNMSFFITQLGDMAKSYLFYAEQEKNDFLLPDGSSVNKLIEGICEATKLQ